MNLLSLNEPQEGVLLAYVYMYINDFLSIWLFSQGVNTYMQQAPPC